MFKKILFLGMLTASLLMGCGGGPGGETRAYTVGGTVEGLVSGQQVTLLNNGGDSLILGNGTFTFKQPIAHNGSYAITVAQQPSDQTCTVSNNSRSGMVANVSDVVVICVYVTAPPLFSKRGMGLERPELGDARSVDTL